MNEVQKGLHTREGQRGDALTAGGVPGPCGAMSPGDRDERGSRPVHKKQKVAPRVGLHTVIERGGSAVGPHRTKLTETP